jgi:putative oxidoreductase
MKYYIERISAILAALILLQTLYFKFTGASESVYIFSQLGIEPYGRIGTGVLELIISGLLLFKQSSLIGSILGMGVIAGAILSHIFVLGIEVQHDGGLLFMLALLVLVLCLINVILQKDKFWHMVKKIKQ